MDNEKRPSRPSISEAKAVGNGESILGNQDMGGLVLTPDGQLYALKHRRFRLNGQPGDYTDSDLVPVCYRIDPLPTREETTQTVTSWLDRLRSGEVPEHATVGVEVEASCYDENGNLISPYSYDFPADTYDHPELLSFTLETATKENGSGLPKTPVEVAQAISEAVLDGYNISQTKGLLLAYTSVPEAGDGKSASITPHPYLITFAPLIAQFTLDGLDEVPSETLSLYEKSNVDVIGQMREGTLNWPVNALHVHTGVPQTEGLADPRAAHACGLIRHSEFSKVLSLMLYNTRHLYGTEVGGKDVRSIARRLIVSSHDATIPQDTETLINEAIEQLRVGRIHSLPRYPDTGQHDRMRLRMDGNKKTIESIEAPMNPDLRLVLAWTYANQLKDVIALDALKRVAGDASYVIPYLQKRWGNIFQVIPTMGPTSSYSQDLEFNKRGYEALSPMGPAYKDLLSGTKGIFKQYAIEYPALRLQAEIVGWAIDKQREVPVSGTTLTQYFGVENGIYRPNGLNRGLVTDYKYGDPLAIVRVQSEATKLQALALSQVKDEKALRKFMGMK